MGGTSADWLPLLHPQLTADNNGKIMTTQAFRKSPLLGQFRSTLEALFELRTSTQPPNRSPQIVLNRLSAKDFRKLSGVLQNSGLRITVIFRSTEKMLPLSPTPDRHPLTPA